MKTNVVTALMVAGVFGGFASGVAQTENSSVPEPPGHTSGPRIEFATDVFNFGKVSSGEVVRHDFVFTNVGNATLEIKDVRPGCGCTTAGTWDKQVEPGKTGTIPLQLNSANMGGAVTKSATVTCNDPGKPKVVLQITGTVWKPIEVTPTMAVFNVSDESETNVTKVVRIVNNLEEPLKLSDLKCTNQVFRAELKTVRPDKEFELHITAVPPFTGVHQSSSYPENVVGKDANDQRDGVRGGAASGSGHAQPDLPPGGALGEGDEPRSQDSQQRDELVGFVGGQCEHPGGRSPPGRDAARPFVQPGGQLSGGIPNPARSEGRGDS